MLGALMLVLMLWAGGVAHAADQAQIVPVTLEAAGHFDGDGDQSPSDRHQGTAHHHVGCGDHHQVASHDRAPAIALTPRVKSKPISRRDASDRGRSPDNLLRPPIA